MSIHRTKDRVKRRQTRLGAMSAFVITSPRSVLSLAMAALPVYVELQRQAAAGDVLHVDDTGVKILACLKENKQLPRGERKGVHTTGIGARDGEHEIALYFGGQRYSGENLTELIKQRPAGLPPPIVMADAEAKNWTPDFQQVVAKCLAHGRRQFVDVAAAFPTECRRVLDDLADVYRNDAATRAMTPEERLAYHQMHGEPILTELRQWVETQLAEHRIEPNNGLGQAMHYILRHYEGLTRFLTVAGAPSTTILSRGSSNARCCIGKTPCSTGPSMGPLRPISRLY